MSLDKAIEHQKERRKPYRDSRRFDGTCENHGSCPWCYGNRTRKQRLDAVVAREEREMAQEMLEHADTINLTPRQWQDFQHTLQNDVAATDLAKQEAAEFVEWHRNNG